MEFTSAIEKCRITFCLLPLAAVSLLGRSQVNVTTYKYDSARTGQNVRETILSPASVSGGNFHRIFTASLDGYVYAQPLYVSGLNGVAGGMSGKAYDVVFTVTEHDSVYALDADSTNPAGSILWHHTYLGAGEAPVSAPADISCGDLVPEVGITSTPVIDINSSTMYFVTKSKEANNSLVQRLHAISLLDGSEKFGGPITIEGQTPDSTVRFDALRQFNRAALLLDAGKVIIGWASHCDVQPYHGWVMAYDSSTLKQLAVFTTTPNGSEGGVWMSGGGIAADAQHRIFFSTGNGDYDGAANQDYADTILRLDPQSNGEFKVGDWFTPWNQKSLDDRDLDLGAGGLLLLPDLPDGGSHPHLLVQMGKNGTMYLLDRDNMGKYCDGCTQDTQIVQSIPSALKGMWGTPAYWNGFIYWVAGRPATSGLSDAFRVWRFNAGGSGKISASPSSQAAMSFRFSAAAPVVSANGNADGVVWLLDNRAFNAAPPGPQVLYAYDATDLTKLLYTSEQAPGGRDRPGGAVKFTTPIVANGRVFAGGVRSLTAWGLVSSSFQPQITKTH
jgi:hypothetical protein